MHPPTPQPTPRGVRRLVDLLSILLLAGFVALAFTGCAAALHDQVYGSSYAPSNVFAATNTLPPAIRRVAVLPLAVEPDTPDAALASLEPVLRAEVSKSNTAEWVFLEPASLRRLSGRSRWGAEDELPPAFLENIQDKLGCDAVLFSRLTRYHPFKPVALGWRFRLVACADAQILWAADDSFDSGVPAVAAAARRYYHSEIRPRSPAADSRMILESPRFFGHYSAQALLATIPGR